MKAEDQSERVKWKWSKVRESEAEEKMEKRWSKTEDKRDKVNEKGSE